jgi:hypothetical protein
VSKFHAPPYTFHKFGTTWTIGIFGPVNENGQYTSRYNKELYELYKDLDLVTLSNLKGYNGLDTFNDCPWTVSQRKPLEQRSPVGNQLESPGKDGRMR